MSALSADVSRPVREGAVIAGVPLQAGAKVRQGSLLEIDAAGRVAPAVKGAGKTYFGVALGPADNTGGAAGALKVDVLRRATVHFSKTGAAVRGKKAYAADDDTVTDAPAGASACGRIVDADDDGVWVELES